MLAPLACLPLPLGAFRRWFEQRRGEALALDRRATWAIGVWTGAMLSLAGAIGGPMKRMRDEIGLSPTWLEELALSITLPFQDYAHLLFPALLLAAAACLRLPAGRRQPAFLAAAIGGAVVWAACFHGVVVSPLWRMARAL